MGSMTEETDHAVTDATEPTEEPIAAPSRFGGVASALRRYRVPLLTGALVFALALAAVFLVLYLTAEPTAEETRDDVARFLDANEAEASETASEVITRLLNYDSTTIDEVADEILARSTGNFKEQYEEIIGSGFGGALKEVAASSRGQILTGPEVSFTSPDEALAIARVEQTSQSTNLPEGRRFVYVLELKLLKTAGGDWKADRVEILSGGPVE